MEISHLGSQANRGLEVGLDNYSLRALVGYIRNLESMLAEVKPYLVAAEDGSMSRNNSEALAGELLEKLAKLQNLKDN